VIAHEPFQKHWHRAAVLGLTLLGTSLATTAAPKKPAALPLPAKSNTADLEFFEKRIRPVLVQSCYECHSAKAEKAKGGLLLDTRAAVLKGGDSGPAIVVGQPEKSLLIKAVRGALEDMQMPPKHKLDEAVLRDLATWVKMGAPDPREGAAPAGLGEIDIAKGRRFWSFQPVKNPPVPKVKNSKWVQTPIDTFVLAKLEERGLQPAPPADKRTLLRRATFDLTGLPPTPEEIDAFLKDNSPVAFVRVVERLLRSPAYGERWGRHWLDVVRYADTAGCNSDFPVPPAYKYRNWVIEALNADHPFDQFVREQIAGDLLPADSPAVRNSHIIATGYLAVARRFASSTNEFHLTLDDSIDNIGKSLLGLSLGCARCHDHKYDPLPTEDYYALYGILGSSTYTFPGVEVVPNPRDYIPLGTPEQVAEWKTYERRLNDLDAEYRRLEPLTRGSKRATNDVTKIRARMSENKKEREALRAHPPEVELAYGVQEGAPHDQRLMRKGERDSLGDPVPRGFLQVLGGQTLPKEMKGAESGRLELAQWITDPKNPLTARVMVNRIWGWHFGKGLVQTPNDFGARGKAPTHPELLDFLATKFIENGWSLKATHRLIMLSSAYQMSSADRPANLAKDVSNEFLWRFDRRRLSAEEIRDTLLAISDTLDRTPGGPHPFPPPKEWHYTQHTPFVEVYPSNHRSVYLMHQRIRKNPFFETWDGADPAASTGVRPLSTTPIQALFMMNDPLVHDSAAKFGQRVESLSANDSDRIQKAFALAYGRPPTKDELKNGEEYLRAITAALKDAGTPEDNLADAAWASYSRVLFSSNEFIFVD
jgi:hypothetical protein